MATVERAVEDCLLGEGPHWDITTQSLYFVDIITKSIVKYTPATNQVTKASIAPKQATFIIPVEGNKDQFIISLDNELVIISWDGKSDKISIVEELGIFDQLPEILKTPDSKFNDAKCDTTGRLWAGVHILPVDDVYKAEPVGSFFTFDSTRQLQHQFGNIRLSNGLAFNDKTKKMFYIDSLNYGVDQFDVDITTGSLSNRKVWFSLKKSNIPGVPDGMTIDTDGNLWVAVFGGSRVLKIDGSKSETLLDTIDIPAAQVTSVAFGGPNLDELYVTTGSLERDGKKRPRPVNGSTYKVSGTGSKGFPAANFKFD